MIQELADATPYRECQLTPAPVPWSCRAWRVVRDVSCVRPTDRSMGPGQDRPFCGRDDLRRNSSCSPSPPDWLNVENLPCGNPTTTFPVLNFFLFQRLWKSVIKHFFESRPYTCPNFQTFLGKSWRFFTKMKIRVLARTRLQTFFSSASGASIYHRCQIYYSASHVQFWHKNQCYFNNSAKKKCSFWVRAWIYGRGPDFSTSLGIRPNFRNRSRSRTRLQTFSKCLLLQTNIVDLWSGHQDSCWERYRNLLYV